MPERAAFAADYIQVNERIIAFKDRYPEGSLQSELIRLDDSIVVMKAYAYRTPDDPRPGIGHSSLTIPGKTPYTRDSELENCETSAFGRALAALGFEVKRGVASREEVANKQPERGEQVAAAGRRAGAPPAAPSPAQYRRGELAELLREKKMHIARLERFADLVGIPKGSRATNIQMDDLIDAVRAYGITQPEPVRAHAGSGVGPATVGRGGDGSSDLPAALDTPHAAGTPLDSVSAELGTQPAPATPQDLRDIGKQRRAQALLDEAVRVSGGTEVPAKPGTPEYKALPGGVERAAAKAYWEKHPEPEPETLAEQLQAVPVA